MAKIAGSMADMYEELGKTEIYKKLREPYNRKVEEYKNMQKEIEEGINEVD